MYDRNNSKVSYIESNQSNIRIKITPPPFCPFFSLVYYLPTNAIDWYKPVLHSNIYDNTELWSVHDNRNVYQYLYLWKI